MELTMVVHRADGKVFLIPVLCRIDTLNEAAYYRHGGILQYVLRGIAKAGRPARPVESSQ
jgi:aconitate hydratase